MFHRNINGYECAIFSSFAKFLVKLKRSFLFFCHLTFFLSAKTFLPCKQRKIWNQEPNECASGHDCDRDAYVHAHVRRRT